VNFIERVMRIMTHVNIGASLGLVVWVLWSGWQVVTGQITPAYRAAEVKAIVSLAHAGQPSSMQLVPVRAQVGSTQPCHVGGSTLAANTVEVLIDLMQPLNEGDRLALTSRFQKADEREATVGVQRPKGSSPAHKHRSAQQS